MPPTSAAKIAMIVLLPASALRMESTTHISIALHCRLFSDEAGDAVADDIHQDLEPG
jgi:hypothetical protein